MQRTKTPAQPWALLLTVVAALLRLIPHPPNFAPIGGLALFGGAKLPGWQAYLLPLLAMVATDPLLSWIAGAPAYSPMTLVIYGSFMINVLLGRTLLGSTQNPWRIGGVALLASTQFYLLTNFFVWFGDRFTYPRTAAGLADCYIAALPFFGRTILADLFYSAALFAAYAFFRSYAGGTKQQSSIRLAS